MRTRLLGLVLVVFTGLFVVGCGSGTVPVSGTIALEDGTPIKSGDLELKQEGANLSALGHINDGKFTVYTYTEGDGCPPGKYTVTIMNADPPVNGTYSDPTTSELKIDVPSGGKTFELKVKK